MISTPARQLSFDYDDMIEIFRLKPGEIVDDIEILPGIDGVVGLRLIVVKKYEE